MQVAWLAAPYLSMLVICRSRLVARCVVGHTGLTLTLGWVAVMALLAAVLGTWSPPVEVMAACGALSGLAVMTPPGEDGGDDDGGSGPDDDDGGGPCPSVDWDAFDEERRRWERERRTTRRPLVGTRRITPSG